MPEMDGGSFLDPSEFADETPFQCEDCGNGFWNETDLHNHQCQAFMLDTLDKDEYHYPGRDDVFYP